MTYTKILLFLVFLISCGESKEETPAVDTINLSEKAATLQNQIDDSSSIGIQPEIVKISFSAIQDRSDYAAVIEYFVDNEVQKKITERYLMTEQMFNENFDFKNKEEKFGRDIMEVVKLIRSLKSK